MTYEHSQPNAWQQTELFPTSSAEGFPAKTSALPEKAQGSPANGRAYGAITPDLLASYDPASSSWRTSQRCFIEDWKTFSEAWPRSGMMRSGTAYPLTPLVPHTSATAFGSWPTMTASDGRRCSELKLSSLGKRAALPGAHWNFAEHVAAELDGYPHPEFVELLMGFPLGWTE